MARLCVTSFITVVLLVAVHVLGQTSLETTSLETSLETTSTLTSSQTEVQTTDLTQSETSFSSQNSEIVTTATSSQLVSTSTASTIVASTTVDQCSSENFCAGPVPVGNKGNSCACPTTYLNIGACCLSQNWIIGLACGSAGVLLIIIILQIGYILAVKSKLDSFAHLSEVSSSSTYKGSLIGAQANHVELDTRGTGNQPAAETAPVAAPVATVDVEVSTVLPVTEPAVEASEDFIYDDSGTVPSSVQQLDGTAGARQRHALSDSPNSHRQASGVYDDVAAETVSSGSTFRPRLEVVDPNADYSIRRPTAI